MKLVVSVFWICCTAEKRDQMSPMWRFSNHSTGRRIRCANTFDSHCRLSVADSTSTAQERMAAVPAWISTSRPKPMPSVASRSRSALTSTSSTTHCIRNGLSSMKASSASASAKICASERFRPLTRPSICRGETCCRSTRGTKSAAGVSSSTTPVKWRDTCSSFSRRRPCAGSWIVATPRLTPTSTTKWFMSQCRMQGSSSCARSSISARSARACRFRLSAMRTRSSRFRPFSDSEKRWRSVGRSERWPCAAATMARQARPHSAPSVCRITGTRLEPKPRRKPPQAPRRDFIPALGLAHRSDASATEIELRK